MKKTALGILTVALVTFTTYRIVRSHCEIPCGIYGDMMRIQMLQEDITTVEKSMNQIITLSKESGASWNQLVRWVSNKEDHANKIQHVVTQYFMTQRVKPVGADARTHKKYIRQLTTLHRILIHAMKAKQTTDLEHIEHLRKLVGEFAKAYLSPADLEHLQKAHSKGK